MVRPYAHNGLLGCVQARRARQTGRVVAVYNTRLAGLDEGESWATVCEEHGTIINHRTLALARYHAADPLGWCERCAGTEFEPL